ncbi:MAG TPA: hypothetical protein VHU81_01495 [Thermoanaerobaculia bacterium]|nr:hypothetical protein [Thermoanaerobaculia bacterium]
MRIRRSVLVFLILLALLAGHYWYWYAARERPAAPEPGGLPARLLASGVYDACGWAPYPHQNIGVLAGAVDDGTAYLEAAARMAGAPPPVLPSFGPFAVPPSSEIVACSDWDGQRFTAAARVYPILGAVARLAGRLAGNPWLAGGEISQAEKEAGASPGKAGLVERVVRVAWRDGYWTVSTGEEPDLSAAATAAGGETEAEPTLARIHLNEEVSQFPAGTYHLRRQDGELELALSRPAGGPRSGPEVGDPLKGLEPPQRPVLFAVAGPAWPAAEPAPLPTAALALFDTGEEQALQLPSMAIIHPEGKERWRIPGQGIAGLLLRRLPRRNVAGWEVVAIDAPSLRRARALLPRLNVLAPKDGSQPPSGRLVLGLWFEPRGTWRLVGRVRGMLEKIPLVDRRQVRQWRDAETLLAPLKPCRQVRLAATESPASFRLRFVGCGGGTQTSD